MADSLFVRKFLENALLASGKSDSVHVRAWINRLAICEDGERLAACLAIDLAGGSLETAEVGSMLESLDTTIADARHAFAAVLSKLKLDSGTDFSCAARFPPRTLEADDTYVNVLNINKFITCYAGPANGYTTSPDSVAEVKRRYFSTPFSHLDDIDLWWAGKAGIVWVTSFKDLNNLLKITPDPDRATCTTDALGITRPWSLGAGDEYFLVAVRYDPAFDSNECFQPTTLDAYWAHPGGFYLSYGKDDGWGRTCSISGAPKPLKERVHLPHLPHSGLTSNFVAFPLGNVTEIKVDRKALLQEAYARVTRFIEPSV
jgi:hypothetical protein